MFGKGRFPLEVGLWEGFGLIFKIFLMFVCISSYVQANHLPQDHYLKPLLDKIFIQSRATLSPDSLKRAGFTNCKPRKYTHVIVTTHPDIPGWVFKLYLDCQIPHKQQSEETHWIARAKGAELIGQIIEKNGFQSLFKVPKKWIYTLPTNSPKGYIEKSTLLIEEDMQILSNKENLSKWKSSQVSQELLSALYIIIRDAGLSDCLKPANIPFSKDGKVAFVDTEIHGKSKIRYQELKRYLSQENIKFWMKLTQ